MLEPEPLPNAERLGRIPLLTIATFSSTARTSARAELTVGLLAYVAASASAIVSAEATEERLANSTPERIEAAAAHTNRTQTPLVGSAALPASGRRPDEIPSRDNSRTAKDIGNQ